MLVLQGLQGLSCWFGNSSDTNDFNMVVEDRIWGKVEDRITENLGITKETRHGYKAVLQSCIG